MSAILNFFNSIPITARVVVLLCCSNLFMLFAWYGHLRSLKEKPYIIALLVSWGIAFFEYTLMIPANRLGAPRPADAVATRVFGVFDREHFGDRSDVPLLSKEDATNSLSNFDDFLRRGRGRLRFSAERTFRDFDAPLRAFGFLRRFPLDA